MVKELKSHDFIHVDPYLIHEKNTEGILILRLL